MHATPTTGHATAATPIGASQNGYVNLPVTKAPSWHGMIAWDVLLNGMATGLFMTAAVSELAAPKIFTPVAKIAYPVALLLLLIDLTMLVFDLGDPLRFHHMLRVFKPGSPMSVGTWCLTIFSLPLTAAAGLSVLAEFGINFEWARILAVIVGLLPAFGSAAYKGVLLSTNAQPGWKDARWLGAYLTNSAILIGCAELLVLSAVLGQAQSTSILRVAFIVLLLLNVIPLGLLFANLRSAHARLYTPAKQWQAGTLLFTAAVLIPLALTLLSATLPSLVASLIFLLSASWAIRFVYVKIPHTPRFQMQETANDS
jgi:Ni/Fe-hydrogenase subunit HybB-like protein